MGWDVWAMLIVKVGLPAAEEIWRMVESKASPTPEDWARVRQLSEQTAESQLIDAIKRNGIDPEDPKAKALIDLAK